MCSFPRLNFSLLILATIDAEKALLDELKKENNALRLRLGKAEDDTISLVDKLAKFAEENSKLERQVSIA